MNTLLNRFRQNNTQDVRINSKWEVTMSAVQALTPAQLRRKLAEVAEQWVYRSWNWRMLNGDVEVAPEDYLLLLVQTYEPLTDEERTSLTNLLTRTLKNYQ